MLDKHLSTLGPLFLCYIKYMLLNHILVHLKIIYDISGWYNSQSVIFDAKPDNQQLSRCIYASCTNNLSYTHTTVWTIYLE